MTGLKKVYVNGYFFNNLGDDLFLYILLERYPETNFYVFLNKKKYRSFYKFKNLKMIDSSNKINNKIFNYYKKRDKKNILARYCDYSVMLGGSIFMEKSCSLKELKRVYGRHQYYILGANIGPYFHQEYLEYIRDIVRNCSDFCVRDKMSYNLIQDLPKARLASDIVLSLSIDKSKCNKKQIFVSVIDLESKKFAQDAQDFYLKELSQMILEYYGSGYEVVVASFCNREKDYVMVEKLKQKFYFIRELYYEDNLDEVIQVIKESEVIVATRFHAMILGFLFNKKVIPMIYNQKMTNFLSDINFQNIMYDILKKRKIGGLQKEYLDVNISEQISSAEDHFRELDKVLR